MKSSEERQEQDQEGDGAYSSVQIRTILSIILEESIVNKGKSHEHNQHNFETDCHY